jgi:polysaccharide export outer membrane protein
LTGLTLVALTGGLWGCETDGFINPGEPKILRHDAKPLVVPILDTLDPSVEEPSSAFSNATEVRPEDLIPDISDYRIGKNDLVNISIFDLLGEGTGETVKTDRVSETGTISLPFIAPVKAEGLTEQQLEKAIIKAYEDANFLKNARVSVTVQEARGRTFSIQGNVRAAGEYQITKPDFRMLDAMVTSGAPSVAVGVPYAFVIRKTTPATSSTPAAAPAEPATRPATAPGDLLAPPQTRSQTNFDHAAVVMADVTTQPATGTPGDLLAPGSTEGATGTIEGKAAPAVGGDATMPAIMPAPATAPFTFADLKEPSDVRVIRVPIDQLRQQGELKYNIVIRPGDMIIVPDPVTGVYYMGGHVQRVGVYSLTGTPVTLKQAWISAGGAEDLAMPSRTEVIRPVGDNKEVFVRIDYSKIWAGEQPDIYLKPNDIVEVGTNVWAPFISAVRNSFRISYGFGFLYDRNFYTGGNNLF